MADDVEALVEQLAGQVRRTLPPSETGPARPAALTARVPPGAVQRPADLARLIDHTLLRADATPAEVVKLCAEARAHGFATVCVNSSQVALAARELAGTPVLAIAVVGFPLGAGLSSAKAFEAAEAVRAGAREVDMVLNLGALKAGDRALVSADIAQVVAAAGPWPVKVILETALLTLEQKVEACVLARAAGAAFVKTCTGFGGGGATVEDIRLMRQVVGDEVGVKASGGVRSAADALKLVAAGANRIGASASVAIVQGQLSTAKY